MYANIIVDISHEKLDKPFQYSVPPELEGKLSEGMRVRVPFGRRTLDGFVIELTEEPAYDVSRIRPVLAVKEESMAIESRLIALAAWIRKNYGGTMNQALKTVLPVKRKEKQKEKKQVRLMLETGQARDLLEECRRKHYSAREKLLAELLECSPQPYLRLTRELGITSAVIKNMREKGVVAVEREYYYRNPVARMAGQDYHIVLNQAQRAVVDHILTEYDAGRPHTYLLRGVTGSGKTEVYMELIAHACAQGRQCIMLIPEISLTFQTVRRFYERFGDRVSILHSRLSSGERCDQFERAKNGDIDIMIGPRSALFTPFASIGFIIIDEEHENSYKSGSVPKYHARETALEQARMTGASVVLGSATPSLESYYHAMKGDYRLLCLDRRVEEKPLPACEIVDMREELRAGNRSILGRRLQLLMEERLLKKQQIMLFINRRGIAGFVSCRACGNVVRCHHCDVSLSQHRNGRLICHYCGYETPMMEQCPVCGSGFIGGFKAGTQKIQELVAMRFPGARILRMDYDTTRTKDSYEQILSAFANHQADILIGTQMIVKGHDFADVTLVGVLAADMALNISDYRAAERTFQLVTHAAGRAGRGSETGAVVIQTYQPEHFSIRTAAAQDYVAFYEKEILYRKLMSYPPVWNMLHILAASADPQTAQECMEDISGWIHTELRKAGDNRIWKKFLVIGPAEAAIAKINDIYRQVLYMKHPDYQILVKVKDFLERKLRTEQRWKKVTVQFDFNPINS